jgi:transcriptional regulator with XRE-family HTH domain
MYYLCGLIIYICNMVDRILLVLKIKNLTPSKFADEIGIQRSSMSHIMSGRNLPSLDLITKILNKYPDINSEWLIQGVGPMMKIVQIDLFEQPVETKTPVIIEKTSVIQPEIEPVIEKKSLPQVEITPEKPSETIQPEPKQPEINQVEIKQPEIKQVEIQEAKQEVSVEKKPDVSPEIEKIVILYKNKTFKEYHPG